MAKKRKLVNPPSKDEVEAENAKVVEKGTFKRASDEEIAKRQIYSFSGPKQSKSTISNIPKINLVKESKSPNASADKKEESSKTNEAAAPHPFAKFMPKPGSWQCKVCLVRNEKQFEKCKACTAPKPGSTSTESNESKADKSNKETESKSESAGEKAKSIFGNSKPLFTFGSSKSSVSTSGSLFNSKPTTGKFTFSGVPQATSKFSFASATGEPKFKFGSSTKKKLNEKFKDAKPSESGEEGETKEFACNVTLFELKSVLKNPPKQGEDEEEKKKRESEGKQEMIQRYLEAGFGQLRLLVSKDGNPKRARLVQRVEKTQKLILNVAVFEKMKFEAQGDHYIRFVAFSEGKPRSYLFKTKTDSERGPLLEQLKKLKKSIFPNSS